MTSSPLLDKPEHEFMREEFGSEFADHVDSYIERQSNPRLKRAVARNVSLFAEHLFNTRQRHSLFEAYSGGAVPPGADLQAELKIAVEESVAAFRQAGYGNASQHKFVTAVRGLIKLLSKLDGRPELGKFRIRTERQRQPKGNRKVYSDEHTPYLSIVEIETAYSHQLSIDIQRVCKSKRALASIRAFLTTLHCDKSPSSRRLVTILKSGEGRTEGAVALVVDALRLCEKRLAHDFAVQDSTARDRLQYARAALEQLGGLKDRHYPAFRRENFRIEHVTTQPSVSLVDLKIPIEDHLKGAARQREALNLIREAAKKQLDRCVLIFDQMQRVANGQLDVSIQEGGHEVGRALQVILQAEQYSFRKTGFGQFHLQGFQSNSVRVAAAIERLLTGDAWELIGLGAAIEGEKRLNRDSIRRVILMGIGATRRAVQACQIIFCCDHGWNLQPIWDIPKDVFFFQVEGSIAVGSLNFIQSFKNRAGHEVIALMERSSSLPLLVKDRVMHFWDATTEEEPWDKNDQHAMMDEAGEAYAAIQKIKPLVDAARSFSRSQELAERFFVHLSDRSGVSGFQESLTIRGTFDEVPLNIEGMSFPAIRKSFQQLTLREVGSVEGLRPISGHFGTDILQRSYVNSEDVVREVLESVRFFQNALQALVASASGISGELRMTRETFEWFFNLAQFSGIAGAIGFGASTPSDPNFYVYNFDPSDESLRSLLLVHLSVKHARKTMEPAKFAIYGVPRLGFIRALEGKLREAGLSPLVRKIARQVITDFRAGEFELLPLV